MPKLKSSNATFWVIFKQCESRIACTLRTTRPGRANNNASKTSPLQAEPKNDPFSTGKIDHHSKHWRERENKAQHNVQPKLQIPEKVSSEYKWKLEGKKKFWTQFLGCLWCSFGSLKICFAGGWCFGRFGTNETRLLFSLFLGLLLLLLAFTRLH